MSEYNYRLQKIYQASPDVVILEVADKNGQPVFDFRPGQYAMITYKNSQGKTSDKHAFSIASSPTQKNFLTFGIRLQGSFTRGLLELKEGSELMISGPFGSFCYDEKKCPNIVFIAGGIGITPFFSALNYATDLKLNNKLALIYSARKSQGATFYSEIKTLSQNNPNISTLFSFTEESSPKPEAGVIYQRVDAAAIKNFVGDIQGKEFFLCGPPPFMTAMVDNLLSLGVKKDKIRMEAFSMIPDQTFMSRLKNLSLALGVAIIMFAVSFYLINKTAVATSQKNYNQALVDKVNQAAIDRLVGVYEAKNKALVDLNQKIINATQTNTNIPISTVAPSQPTQTYTPAPVSVPTPRTRVS